MIMILRGRFSAATSSSTEWHADDLLALGRARRRTHRPCDVVRLKTATVKPWLSMFRTRFSPITARPIRPMSAVGAVVAMFACLNGLRIRVRSVTSPEIVPGDPSLKFTAADRRPRSAGRGLASGLSMAVGRHDRDVGVAVSARPRGSGPGCDRLRADDRPGSRSSNRRCRPGHNDGP